MKTYNKEYLLKNPPKSIKDLKVWVYVVNNKMKKETIETTSPTLIKHYQNKIEYIERKNTKSIHLTPDPKNILFNTSYDNHRTRGIIISKVNENIIEEGRLFFTKIASFDLSGVNPTTFQDEIRIKGRRILSWMDDLKVIPVYFPSEDEDTKITKNLYGDEFIAFEPEILIEELKRKEAEKQDYRFSPLIGMLENMLLRFGSKFYVVFFGH